MIISGATKYRKPVLLRPATKIVRGKAVNNAGENVISNGSLFDVGVNQCAIFVENGKVHDLCAEPGQYRYDTQLEPSMLGGGLKDLGPSFKLMLQRFKAGGMSTNTMKIFYVNLKEIQGNKIGIGDVPFRDSEFGFTVKVMGYGVYSYRITDPLLFFENVTGTTLGDYPRSRIDEQLKSELQMAMQPALGKIAAMRISYDQLINYPKEIGEAVNQEMTPQWQEKRGISIVSIAFASITVDEESSKKIAQFQESRVYTNPGMMGARLGGAQANAMETAASNSAGAMTGFLGMGFAQQAGEPIPVRCIRWPSSRAPFRLPSLLPPPPGRLCPAKGRRREVGSAPAAARKTKGSSAPTVGKRDRKPTAGPAQNAGRKTRAISVPTAGPKNRPPSQPVPTAAGNRRMGIFPNSAPTAGINSKTKLRTPPSAKEMAAFFIGLLRLCSSGAGTFSLQHLLEGNIFKFLF